MEKLLVSDISRFSYDYPIRLLSLNDHCLYDRTQLIRSLVGEIAQEMEKRKISDYDERMVSGLFETFSRYAIFSHRWGPDEITYGSNFSDIISSGTGDGATKLRLFCDRASQYGCRYVWFDTGCINSANSAELDESIRSMYAWYARAYVCIVFLAQTESKLNEGENVDEWFRRGWTLQELLAPERLKFYNKDWDPLTENDFDILRCGSLPPESKALVTSVSKITGVDEQSLRRFNPQNGNVRRVLTWVANRRTSRPEDIVYCLFGLLDVSLNIAYGEGKARAFARLQIELLKRYDDRSLLIFDGETSPRNRMLPSSPAAFSIPFQGRVLPSDTILFREGITSPDISLSIYGLHLSVVLYPVNPQPKDAPWKSATSIFSKDIGVIPCRIQEHGEGRLFLAILGHAQMQRRILFGVLLVLSPYSHTRYQRVFTEPPYLQIAAATLLMNKQMDETVMLKAPEMIYIE
ncbi:hypothetical protein ONZ45_g6464 [Pleurotus djamor]|nr:hypothetical protein ONZ45_g6464 [Pleurotus djamor]